MPSPLPPLAPAVLCTWRHDDPPRAVTFAPPGDLHRRIAFDLWHCRAGRLILQPPARAEAVRAGPGDVLVSQPGEAVTLAARGSCIRLAFDLGWRGRRRGAGGRLRLAHKRPQPSWHEQMGSPLLPLVPATHRAEAADLVDELQRSVWIPHLAHRAEARLHRWLVDHAALTAAPDPAGLAFAERVEALYRLHLGDGITLGGVARLLGVSRQTLLDRYRAERGCAPGESAGRIRLEYAFSALRRRPFLRMVGVARRCGYRDAASFARWFRATTGLSPTVWRERHAGDHAVAWTPRQDLPPRADGRDG